MQLNAKLLDFFVFSATKLNIQFRGLLRANLPKVCPALFGQENFKDENNKIFQKCIVCCSPPGNEMRFIFSASALVYFFRVDLSDFFFVFSLFARKKEAAWKEIKIRFSVLRLWWRTAPALIEYATGLPVWQHFSALHEICTAPSGLASSLHKGTPILGFFKVSEASNIFLI